MASSSSSSVAAGGAAGGAGAGVVRGIYSGADEPDAEFRGVRASPQWHSSERACAKGSASRRPQI